MSRRGHVRAGGCAYWMVVILSVVLLGEPHVSGFLCSKCFWEEIDRQGPQPLA